MSLMFAIKLSDKINMVENKTKMVENKVIKIIKELIVIGNIDTSRIISYLQSCSDFSTNFCTKFKEGYLEVICGPMFSEKTTKAILKIAELMKDKHNTIFVSHTLDDRESDDEAFSTHNNLLKVLESTKEKRSSLLGISEDFDCYVIDEAQFFEDLVDGVKYLLSINKRVYVYGVDGSFEMEHLGLIHELLPLSNKFEKVSAICKYCNCEAPFTIRLSEEKSLYKVGGSDEYAAVCRTHFILYNENEF